MGKSEFLLQFIIFGAAAAIVALIVIKVYPSPNTKTPSPNSFESADSYNLSKIAPNSIKIPSIGLNLPIEQGVISQNSWTLFDDKVSWLATSEIPGKGNVILYAHNKPHLFGNLKKVNVGDEIIVNSSGEIFTYKVKLKQKVTPENIDAVLAKNHQLTLYTCDGSFDKKRLIVIAIPDNLN